LEKSAVGDVETVSRPQVAVSGHARERIAQVARGFVSAMVAPGGFHRKGSKKGGLEVVAGQEAAVPSCDGRARYTRRFRFANIFFTSADRADGRRGVDAMQKSVAGIAAKYRAAEAAEKTAAEAAEENRAAEAA
jgi:hypothetical protein